VCRISFDELHTIVGAGSAEGALDASKKMFKKSSMVSIIDTNRHSVQPFAANKRDRHPTNLRHPADTAFS
jgi:hypothetical protein